MILTYHKIGNQLELGITTVSRGRFAGHLDLYCKLGLKPIQASRVPEQPDQGGTLAITFDDGYESVWAHALPEMETRGWTGTVFIVAGSVGGENSWDVRLSPRRFKHLSWPQIEELAGAGFEIGSHTLSHRDLTRLDMRSLRAELRASKQLIEDRLGIAVTSISYPFGAFSQKVVDEAIAAGYRCGFTSIPNSGSDRMAMGRLGVYSIDSLSSLERKLGLRRGYALECLKSRVIAKLSLGTTMVKR